MTDPLTPNKGFDLQSTGENSGTWGVVLNQIFTETDTALGGVTTISLTGVTPGNHALSLTQYLPPNIEFTGTVLGNFQWYIPAGVGGMWSVYNNTTGAFFLAFASSPVGSAINIPQGQRILVICDGTTVSAATTPIVSANPLALVSTSPVNGTLGTFMTSDSAPAIDQTMSPNWTGDHTFEAELNLTGTMNIEAAGIVATAAGSTMNLAGATINVATAATGSNSTLVASTAFVQNTLGASPALGGNPTTTTQTATNNTTRIASTAFVQAVIAALPVNAGNAANGSISIGALIINYGLLTTPGSSPTTVNYTTAYTTAVYAVVPYLVGANQTYFVGAGFGSSLSHWTLNFGGAGQVVGWIAIGT